MEGKQKREIERLFLKLYPLLFEYARSVLSNNSLAEEAVQDAFAIACRKPDALVGSPNPEGWMVKTLKNVLRNTVRDQNTARRILAEYLAAHENELVAEDDRTEAVLLYEDIAETAEFKLVKAIALDGKSYLEVAEELGITVTACRKRMQRAREFLQKKIKP